MPSLAYWSKVSIACWTMARYLSPGHSAITVAKRRTSMISPGVAPARRHSVAQDAMRSSCRRARAHPSAVKALVFGGRAPPGPVSSDMSYSFLVPLNVEGKRPIHRTVS